MKVSGADGRIRTGVLFRGALTKRELSTAQPRRHTTEGEADFGPEVLPEPWMWSLQRASSGRRRAGRVNGEAKRAVPTAGSVSLSNE